MGLSSTSSKSTNSPWSGATPAITAGLSSAQNILNSNAGALQQQSTDAYNDYQALASKAFGSNSLLDNASTTAAGLSTANNIGSGNATLTSLANGTTGQGDSLLQSLTGGAATPGSSTLSALSGYMGGTGDSTLSSLANGGQSDAAAYDRSVLAGNYLNGSPYLTKQINSTNDAITRAANARFAGTGMGAGLSTAYTDLLGRNLSTADNTLLEQNYQAERANQEAASGRITSAYNQDVQNRLAAATGLNSDQAAAAGLRYNAATGLNSAAQSNYQDQLSTAQALNQSGQATAASRLAAAQGLNSSDQANVQAQLAALGLIPSLNSAQYTGANSALSALGLASSLPYTGLNAYANAVSALAGRYGTTTSSSTPSLASQLGTGLQLASLFG